MDADTSASTKRVPIFVVPASKDEDVVRRGRELAQGLGLPLELPEGLEESEHLRLVVHRDGLELAEGAKSRQQPITIDFAAGPTGYRRVAVKGKRELIARAVGDRARHQQVVDATAGLARDAFLLAVLGYQVTAVERSPVLAAMVQDAIARTSASCDETIRDAVSRLSVICADAAEYLRQSPPERRPDVVYLDPMYESSHGSALAKKEMRVLRKLVGDDSDAAELLRVARSVAKKRVVVKRHRYAPALAEEPSHAILGTRVRYDVYMISNARHG